MIWFLFALAAALFSATEAAVIKRWFADAPTAQTMAAPLVYSLPLFFLLLLLLEPPPLQPGFWTHLFILIPLNALGMGFAFWAIKVSPLSLTMPFQSLTPALTLATGMLILGETPSVLGVAGVFLLVGGSYILTSDAPRAPGDLFAPFKAILAERGSRLMCVAAAVFSLAAVYGKQLINLSGPLYAGAMFFCIHNVVVVGALLVTRQVTWSGLFSRPRPGGLLGGLIFIHILCHFTAIALTHTAYMIAVKRLNGLFGVLYGGLLFKEGRMKLRLIGAGLMGAGAAVVALVG